MNTSSLKTILLLHVLRDGGMSHGSNTINCLLTVSE